ncbi:MAG TPA: phytanoyl-CoA dioxygenase family protein [Polyangia bacterium]
MDPTRSPSSLSASERAALRNDGYVVRRGLVPAALVTSARHAINASLGSNGIPPEQLPVFRARTFTPELVTAPELMALFAGPVAALAEAALGPGNVRPPREAQIALRFPTTGGGSPAVPHIDGISAPGNGVPPGTLFHFTALAAVFLSDVRGDDRGNFTVWPGSHHKVAAHFRAHGPQSMVDGFPALELGAPRAIEAEAGDALLAHYALAHGIAPNAGPDVRYAVFFRLFHRDHESFGTRVLTEPWAEWPGVVEPGTV